MFYWNVKGSRSKVLKKNQFFQGCLVLNFFSSNIRGDFDRKLPVDYKPGGTFAGISRDLDQKSKKTWKILGCSIVTFGVVKSWDFYFIEKMNSQVVILIDKFP